MRWNVEKVREKWPKAAIIDGVYSWELHLNDKDEQVYYEKK